MSQKNGTPPKRNPAKTLPARKYLGEYWEDLVADDEEPSPMEAKAGGGLGPLVNYEPLSELEKERRRASRLLQKAADRHDNEGFGRLLYVFTREFFGIKNIPEGVIQMRLPPQTGGRPVSKERDRIYQCWLKNDQPPLTSHTLAWLYYGKRFEQADAAERRRLRDQCRAAVMRARQQPRASRRAT